MNRLTKKRTLYILAVILAIIQLFFGKNNPLPKSQLIPTNVPTPISCRGQACLTRTKVVRVIDGDTIEIEGKIKVRYIGINTPEIYHDTTGKKTGEQCFAEESYLENKRLVEGKTVTLVKDISDKDKYGRLLRYVYIEDLFINDYLIKNGYAKLMTIKPDIKYSQEFKTLEKEAKINNLGMWEKCSN
ncbi:MAG: thermonuclease family protein [Patescibacteria group bacterium]|jgi:micrococcal nuclease